VRSGERIERNRPVACFERRTPERKRGPDDRRIFLITSNAGL
jgi:hypothetical protein